MIFFVQFSSIKIGFNNFSKYGFVELNIPQQFSFSIQELQQSEKSFFQSEIDCLAYLFNLGSIKQIGIMHFEVNSLMILHFYNPGFFVLLLYSFINHSTFLSGAFSDKNALSNNIIVSFSPFLTSMAMAACSSPISIS